MKSLVTFLLLCVTLLLTCCHTKAAKVSEAMGVDKPALAFPKAQG